MTLDSYIQTLLTGLISGSNVLDVGCGEALFYINYLHNMNINYFGVDIQTPRTLPKYVQFRPADIDAEALPYDDDTFDLLVCQHVIEHLRNPIELFGEMVRVCRPGGHIFIVAPSDHSTWFSFPLLQNWRHIYSYYDDPTHLGRPWTPQGLYRLGIFWDMYPIISKYDCSTLALLLLLPKQIWGFLTKNPDLLVSSWWRAIGWIVYATFKKPNSVQGKTNFHYKSFLGFRP